MKNPLHKLNKNHSLTVKLLLSTALMFAASSTFADDANLAYVDSVHKWGAWELDIEPAAGGITPPSTGALNARNSKVTLRINSIAALAPPAPAPAPIIITSTPIPVPPATPPAIPTVYIPTVTTIGPNVPIPVGAP